MSSKIKNSTQNEDMKKLNQDMNKKHGIVEIGYMAVKDEFKHLFR